MGKLSTMIVVLMTIQFAVILFWNLSPQNEGLATNSPYGEDSASNSLWSFITNPSLWIGSSFWDIIVAVAGITTAAAAFITISTFIFQKSDLVLLSPVAVFFFAFGSIPIISLFMVINSESQILCQTEPGINIIPGMLCWPSILVAFCITGILTIMWLSAVLEFWTGRPA